MESLGIFVQCVSNTYVDDSNVETYIMAKTVQVSEFNLVIYDIEYRAKNDLLHKSYFILSVKYFKADLDQLSIPIILKDSNKDLRQRFHKKEK